MHIELGDVVLPDFKGRFKLRWESIGLSRRQDTTSLFNSSEPVDISMDNIAYVGHDGLQWLLVAAAHRKRRHVPPLFLRLPNRTEVIKTMRELRFPEKFALAGGEIANRYPLNRPETDPLGIAEWSLMQFQVISSRTVGSIVEGITDYVDNNLATELGISPISEPMTLYASSFDLLLQELVTNVVLHGGVIEAKGDGFAALRRPHPKYPVLRFVCGDVGPGLTETLRQRRKVRVSGDHAAFLEALLYRATHRDDAVIGLYKALMFLSHFRGKLRIRSGTGLATLDLEPPAALEAFRAGYSDGSEEWLRRLLKIVEVPSLPGVHICLDLRVPEASPQ
jgi:hypothetical protein